MEQLKERQTSVSKMTFSCDPQIIVNIFFEGKYFPLVFCTFFFKKTRVDFFKYLTKGEKSLLYILAHLSRVHDNSDL